MLLPCLLIFLSDSLEWTDDLKPGGVAYRRLQANQK